MGWSNAVITLAGTALVAQLINGGKLSLTRVEISENTIPAASLITQKTIVSPLNVPVAIAGKKTAENSLSVRIQVQNTGAVGTRKMRQLGLYAKTETVEETLFAILQNEQGDEIPPETEYPQFLLEMTVLISVSNANEIAVVVNPHSVFVTQETLDLELEDYVPKNDFNQALELKADKTELPTTLPANGGNAATVNGHTVKSDVPANAKFTDTVYNHPTSSGNKHIPSGGASGQILRWSADGEATWGNDNNTTYSNASASVAGLVSTGTQTFAGKKTFTGQVIPDGATACGTAQARKLSSGTASATTTNCPSGAWYAKYE